MTWTLQVTGPAQKDFRKLPTKDQAHVKAALVGMQEDPFSGDVVRLKAQRTAWRRGVANYRVFFDVFPKQRLVMVTAILRRTSTTYRTSSDPLGVFLRRKTF